MDNKSSPEDQLYPPTGNADENFFDTSDVPSPVFDNSLNASPSMDNLTPEERERQRNEWHEELVKLEDEIQTLRQVLSAKVRQSSELKRTLGITPMVELKHDLKQGIQNLKDSEAYQKTNTAIKTVGQKTSSAFSSVSAFTSRKLTDARNSTAFKSFEEKMGGAYSNVKDYTQEMTSRVSGSKSEQNFEDVLNDSVSNDGANEKRQASSVPATPADEQVPL